MPYFIWKVYQKEKKSKKKVARIHKTWYTTWVFPILHTMLTQLEVNKSSTNTGVKIFAFKWELDETNVDTTFPNIIADIGDFAHSRTLFDFRELSYLNSKSIGYIADIAQRTEDGGGKFCICGLSTEVHDTLELVGITSIVPVYESSDAAVMEMSK